MLIIARSVTAHPNVHKPREELSASSHQSLISFRPTGGKIENHKQARRWFREGVLIRLEPRVWHSLNRGRDCDCRSPGIYRFGSRSKGKTSVLLKNSSNPGALWNVVDGDSTGSSFSQPVSFPLFAKMRVFSTCQSDRSILTESWLARNKMARFCARLL